MWIRKGLFLLFCLWVCSGLWTEAAAPAITYYEDGDVVGFIGDSITHVTYSSLSYVEMLDQYYRNVLPERTVEFRNLGADGFKAGDVLNIYDQDPAFRGISKAVIMLGTNEAILGISPEEYMGNMEELVGRLKEDGLEGEDILILSPPLCDQDWAGNYDRNGNRRWHFEDRVLQYMEALENETAEWGVCYLDLHTPMAELTGKLQQADTGNSLTRDSIHPDAAGQRLLAYYILQAQGADSGPWSAIILPREGEAAAFRGELTDFYRGARGICWNWRPEALPIAVTEDITKFRDLLDDNDMQYGSLLKAEGLSAEVTYMIRMAEKELGGFTGKELAEGIDLNTLEGHPGRALAEQMAALNRQRHQEVAAYRKMWIEVMMQRASYTGEEIEAAYSGWRTADEQLRQEMRTLADEMADTIYPMIVLEEGYTEEELEQEAREAWEAAGEQARLEAEKAAEEQARLEEAAKRAEEEQARIRAEEQLQREAAEREAQELARLEAEKAQRTEVMQKRLLAAGVCLGGILAVLIVVRIRKRRKG